MATFITPGPSQPYPKLRAFLSDALTQDVISLSHRSKPFMGIYKQTDETLKAIMEIPEDYRIVFMGSATEAMERIVEGVVISRSHHFVYGAFSEKWYEMAQQLGKKPTITKVEHGNHFTKKQLSVPEDTELVCLTQNETSTGAAFPLEVLNYVIDNAHDALIALDVVSSAPMIQLPWEKLDLVFFSVQKAFGLPAGLGVLIMSPKALKKAQYVQDQGISIGSYHSLLGLAEAGTKYQTPETPNVLGIYLLSRVARDMQEIGIKGIIAENRRRSALIYETLDNNRQIETFVKEPNWRSFTVAVIDIRGGSRRLHDELVERDLIPAKGYGSFKDQHLRLANFPSIETESFDSLISHIRSYEG
jgi:phosphoserine aminotransferase